MWSKNKRKYKNIFFLEKFYTEIKHKTTCKDYKYDVLKIVDTPYKIVSLQCSWVRRLYNDCFYEWKLIPLQGQTSVLK